MTTLYNEGNNGGDYIKIENAGDGLLRLEVGHCCVKYIDHIVPVELVTYILAMGCAGGVTEAVMATEWANEFKAELAKKVKGMNKGW